jgi:hypothetical protein
LEEYEKTGESKVTTLNSTDQEEYIRQEAAKKEVEKLEKKQFEGVKGPQTSPNVTGNSNASTKVPTSTIVSSNSPGISVNNEINSSFLNNF